MTQNVISQLFVSGLLLVSTNSFAGESLPSIPKSALQPKVVRPTPILKPNLKPVGISWDGEFCNMSSCAREFATLGFNKATCNIYVRIKNNGSLPVTSSFTVALRYLDWRGNSVIKRVNVSGLRNNSDPHPVAGSVLVKFTNIGYYRLSSPFSATVDSSNVVSESNESDNSMSAIP